MQTPTKFTCFIIGESTLVTHCANILLHQGHKICGIVSADKLVNHWAQERGISHIEPTDDLRRFFSQEPFDYLFSIVNAYILPKEILEIPRKFAINYHDAPLPRYGGTHVTSWALMNRETSHGVTWHVVSDLVDAGDILKQRCFEIVDDESAFTLNVKCYEAAIHSFAELVADLSYERVSPRKQNLDERTFFSRFKRIPTEGILSWNRSAYDLHALIRALDFGAHTNPLGVPKLLIENDFFIIPEIGILDSVPQTPAGTITKINDDSLQITTLDFDITLHKVITLDGQSLSISDFVARFSLHKGYQFRDADAEKVKRIEALYTTSCKHEAFWVRRLASLKPMTLPWVSNDKTLSVAVAYARVRIPIPDEALDFLKNQNQELSTGELLFAAFGAYLARIGGVWSFDLGFRSTDLQGETEGLNKLFALDVPLRINVDYSQSFAEFVYAVKQEVELVRRQKSYVNDVVRRYPSLRRASEAGGKFTLPITLAEVNQLDQYEATAQSEISLVILKDGSGCHFVYDTGRFGKTSVERIIIHFTTFLLGITEKFDQRIADLPLLTNEERQQLLVEWNDTRTEYPRSQCIHKLFEAQAERKPEAVALVYQDEYLSYGELNRRANQLAHYLQKLGVKPDVLVGICVERSIEMVVGLLGILKAGGAYVPLDRFYPQERLSFMLEDAHVPVILTQESLTGSLPKHELSVVRLDTDWKEIAKQSTDNLPYATSSEKLAYVMYTSGSTGRPKGVCIPHRAVVRLVKETNYVKINEQEVFLQLAPISFDASTFEIWGCLLNGARLVVISAEAHTLEELSAVVEHFQVTILWLTAGLFHQMVDYHIESLRGVRQLLAGGDVLSVAHVEKVLEQLEEGHWLINGYGPTENTTFTCCYSMRGGQQIGGSAPIGRPVSNTTVYILDEHLQVLPVGLPGELYTGGDGLARGYLNRAELTAEKFIVDPFNTAAESRLYKTGDLARYLPDGNIEFLGRIDNQVKIRGFRIELGEIESVLMQHPSVREVVVVAREDMAGEKRLVSYVVPEPETTASVGELRRYLRQVLPDYMVPVVFMELKALPLTPNGKVDRRALPMPDQARPELEESFVAPRNPIEEIVAEIWAKILRVERVGIYDNFFELGGDSLSATQVISWVRAKLQVELPLSSLFESSTVARLAEMIEAVRHADSGQQALPILPVARDS
ncbi:MAG: amino acid adenylation domain-containing protein [Pyrinomonadaceae bacterium]